MSYSNLTTGGGRIVWASGGDGLSEDSRTLPRQNNGVVYIQFLSQFGSTSGGGTPNIRLLDSGLVTGGFGGNGGTHGAFMSILDSSLNAATDGSSSSSASLASSNLVVARIDYLAQKTSMWVNPDLSTFDYENPGTTPDAIYTGLAPAFDGISIVSRSPGDVDEISVFYKPVPTPAPVLNSPLPNSTNGSPGVFISYTLPATPQTGTVQLSFTNNLHALTLVLTNSTNVSFLLLPQNPLASPYVVSTIPGSATLADGIYNVQLSYQDTNSDPVASVLAANILVDTVTQPSVLFAPNNNAIINSGGLHISYQLSEVPAPGSVRIMFQNATTNIILHLNDSVTNDFVVFPRILTNAAITSTTAAVLPDGIYVVSLIYQDALLNPVAFSSVTNVLVDTTTLPPLLFAPSNNTTFGIAGVHISYQLPEVPGAGSVTITFLNYTNPAHDIILNLNDSQTNDFIISPKFLTNAAVTSANSSILPDGTYEVELSYHDALWNLGTLDMASNVVVATVTQPPILLSPSDNAVVSSTGLHISYELPEAPAPDSVVIAFQNSATNIILRLNNNQTNDFIVSPSSLQSAAAITSATSPGLPDGRYVVSLRYQDVLLNPGVQVLATNVLTVLEPLNFYPISLAYTNGIFELEFSNNLPTGLGFNYGLMTSSNLNAPLRDWIDLGPITEAPPGHFQFQEIRANSPAEFYILRVY